MAEQAMRPELKTRTVTAALAAATEPQRRLPTPPAWCLWLVVLALCTAPWWAPSSVERDLRFDRGATRATHDLIALVTKNLHG